ncbi:MAG TPA: hypothetical protein VMO75_05645 [Chthoniobacterales bacterium]|jgi:hypothetical protein|nr:hypothetical protein [Chthoniobacterales bacterium]
MSIRKLTGLFFLAACVTTAGLGAGNRPDVVQVITKSDASDILGEAVKDPSPRNGEGADGYYSKCNYYSVRRGKSLVIRLQLPGPNAIAPDKELQLVAQANGSTESVSGVGDAAQMFTTGGESGFASRVLMLYVVKGKAFLTIGVSGFANDAVALEKAKTVAQKLVDSL